MHSLITRFLDDKRGTSINSLNNTRKLNPLMPSPQHTTYSPIPTISPNGNQDGQSKTRGVKTEPIISSRWNPTREQIHALEEMYRGGTRTPSAEQIQQITTMLRHFGRIEGKNVFYWFQNHKARERQKRRRQLESSLGDQKHIPKLEKREPGTEVGRKGKWASPSTCSSTLSEESVSIQRRAVAKREIDERFQVDDQKLQQIKSSTIPKARVANREDENRGSQMLQLFPPLGNNCGDGRHDCGTNAENDATDQEYITSTNTSFVSTPVQFFEFLPMKS